MFVGIKANPQADHVRPQLGLFCRPVVDPDPGVWLQVVVSATCEHDAACRVQALDDRVILERRYVLLLPEFLSKGAV